jgi:hypothetical protein
MKKVFVVNKSSHDFSSAEKFGELVFCTIGRLNRFNTNDMVRRFQEAMEESSEDDYILPCSLNVANALAGAVFAMKHGAVNLLLFKDGEYVERNHVLE